MSSVPVDDQGRHELILRVVHQRDRFCYRYTFGGAQQYVAPVIRVHRGERFAIRIVNELRGPASGATMAASALPPCMPMQMGRREARPFSGYLNHTQYYERNSAMPPTDVNLHLHGFQGPASQENVFLSTLSTPAHACEFNITIPQTQPVGTYLYHPHAHGMAEEEIAGGLSGMWIVEPDTPQIAPENEHEVVLRYQVPAISDDDRFMPPLNVFARAAFMHELTQKDPKPVRYDPFNPPAWPSTWPTRAAGYTMPACGILAESLLSVNGGDGSARLTVPANEPQLLRILNATADSFEYIHLHDAAGNDRPMQIVGRDGVPISGDSAHPFSRFIAMSGIDLVPTNRADVLLTLKPGETLTLSTRPNCFSAFDEYQLAHDLLTITAGPPAASPLSIATAPLTPQESRTVELLRYARAHASAIRKRAFTYTEYPVPNIGKRGAHPEFYITQTSELNFHERPFHATYAKNALVPQPDVVVKRGSIEEWYLFNTTLEPHTFHMHQMAFVAEDELPQPVMLDTVLVPVGKMLPNKADPDYPLIKPGLTRILLDFRNVPRGTFAFHCHMVFHEDRGMMRVIKVI
ncbi:MAG TPA: multicopper oxidase family protein [Candidatus Baltobacteraceae bacterium]|nr:multicopper oxidase family protein [Candidatus Baltobacteraceae bacterium]